MWCTCNQQWATKVVETLLENDTFRYLSIYSILLASSVNCLIPQPLNSMFCRRCALCSLRNGKISIVWRGKGGNVFKTLENQILLSSVSTLLSSIVELLVIQKYIHVCISHLQCSLVTLGFNMRPTFGNIWQFHFTHFTVKRSI